MKTLFPPYAHPSPGLPLDNETWIVRDLPGERRTLHQSLGRIDLDWGSRSLADVLADVEAWRADGAEGLFLDRAPAGSGGVGPVALTVRLAARRGLHRVVLNPGVPTHPLYRDLGVRICTFEGPWSAYQSWDGEGVRPGDGHIVHGVPVALLTAARRLMGRRGAGFGLATDASPYPWVSAAASAGGAGSEGS
ncbi:Spherulin-4 [Actinoplanes sp. TBRC 11911]|uniref:spherulation-specific family 4 protein n=1 Tax=Actinoplanes sp. TBRC 11911 TaxID=2729386 RepID=UPI00145E2142|nr:spherulation-specific family 4 protein [Actinoplanes sp. TBRC 11911]NMO52590.1 Spherulin-4 [Actinoplanes sp. TBRC 11911]